MHEELFDINIGDERLNRRLILLGNRFLERPNASIPQSCEGWKESKAAYRLFSNNKLTCENMIDIHRQKTLERSLGCKEVLAIQDTTYVTFKGHHRSKLDLGNISCHSGRKIPGLIIHNTLLASLEGTPFGLFDQQIINRKNDQIVHTKRPLEERETFKWIESIQTIKAFYPEDTDVISVADREGDLFPYLLFMQDCSINFVVRSCYNRIVGDRNPKSRNIPKEHSYLKDHLAKIKWKGELSYKIYDNKLKKQRNVTFKYKSCSIRIPASRIFHGDTRTYPEVDVNVIELQEKGRDKNRLNWRLFTTLKVDNEFQIQKVVNIYKKRWLVEEYHRILKSGCTIEDLRLETFERLKKCLTLYSIVAWKLLLLTKIGREHPNRSCEALLKESEWKVLMISAKGKGSEKEGPPKMKDAIYMIAKLGGYLARKSDGPPGMTSIWTGWRALEERHKFYLELTCG